MLNDHLSNMMSRLDNVEKKRKKECLIRPNTKLLRNILEILKTKKYIQNYEIKIDKAMGGQIKVSLHGAINRCGSIKPRFSVQLNDFEKYEKRYLPAAGFGILIVSTSKGIMTHEESIKKKIGGKLLAYCY